MINRLWAFRDSERAWLLKAVIVAAVLCVDLLAGMRATPKLILLAAALGVGLLIFLLFSRWMELGIAALVPATFLGRVTVGTGTNVPFNLAILLSAFLLGLWILQMFVVHKEVRLLPSRVNLPAIIMIVITTLALVAGNINWIPIVRARASFFAQIGGWMLYVFSVGLLLLVGNRVRSLDWLQRITWLFLIFGGVYVCSRLVPGLTRFTDQFFLRPGGYENPFGSVFWIWIAAVAFGQALLNTALRPAWRVSTGLLFAATLYISWFQSREWVSGWLPPLIAVGVIVWLTSWRWGAALTLAGGLLVVYQFSSVSSAVMTTTQEYSLHSRTATWPILYDLIKANPILGLGPSNYYYYTPLYSLFGWYVNFNSHNNYLDLLAQTGVLGLGAFAWLAGEIGFLGWRLRKTVRDPFSQAYVITALGGLVGVLFSGFLGDWFLPFLYNVGTSGFRFSIYAWLFLGGLVAIEQIQRQPEGGLGG